MALWHALSRSGPNLNTNPSPDPNPNPDPAKISKAYLCTRQADSANKWLPTVWTNVKAQVDIIMKVGNPVRPVV